jgi:PKD repeat protein
VVFGAAWAVAVVAIVAPAGADPALEDALPNLDVRYSRFADAAGGVPAAQPLSAVANALEPGGYDRPGDQLRLEEAVGQQSLRFSYDPVFNTPRFIRSTSNPLQKALDGQARDVRQALSRFMNDYRGIMLVEPEELANTRIVRQSVSPVSGAEHIRYGQQIGGVDIFGAELRATVSQNGDLMSVSSLLLDSRRVQNFQPQTPTVTAVLAVIRAAADLGHTFTNVPVVVHVDDAAPNQTHTFMRTAELWYTTTASKIYFPVSPTEVRIAWDVTIPQPGSYLVYRHIIDGANADVLFRERLTRDAGTQPVSYRVYTGDSPAPLSPFPQNAPKTIQAPPVNRTLQTLIALDEDASPLGWINDGVNALAGNNVEAIVDRDFNFVDDLVTEGTPNRVFDFALSPNDAPKDYAKASVTNLFYWCNFCHDRMYQLGFDEPSGNFQDDNFGRGGFGSDRLLALCQAGSDVGFFNNAFFVPSPDGSESLIAMFIWSGPNPDRDGSLDAHIVVHEFTHGLSTRLHGDLFASQSGGMGEGWSDFYALSLLAESADDPDGIYPMAGYATLDLGGADYDQNYYFGIRRYPYSTNLNVNPLTYQDIDPTQIDLPDDVPISPLNVDEPDFFASEVHNAGEVWCAMLWEARANIVKKVGFVGNEQFLQVVTEAMKLSPPNPSFIEARDAILQADVLVTGGQFFNEIWDAFAKRGMGFSASGPGAFGNIGILEANDLPRPFAAARSTVRAGLAPLTVMFNGVAENLSRAGRLDSWSFGDGSTRDGETIGHTYTEPGSYLAVFEAVDTTGASARASVSIEVLGRDAASGAELTVVASPRSGVAPVTVEFTGDFGGAANIVSWNWAFGDGKGAVGQQVTHTFDDPGVFTTTLTATDSGGNQKSRSVTITVSRGQASNAQNSGQTVPSTRSGRSIFCGSIGMVSMAMLVAGLCGLALMRRRII